MRAIVDVNVLISALLSPTGAPANLLLAWQHGQFELLVSPLLLAELGRALAYPKLRRLIPAADAEAFSAWLRRTATPVTDPNHPPSVRSLDPGDDYLLALAVDEHAALVSGDRHLLALADDLLVYEPARFLDLLTEASR